MYKASRCLGEGLGGRDVASSSPCMELRRCSLQIILFIGKYFYLAFLSRSVQTIFDPNKA